MRNACIPVVSRYPLVANRRAPDNCALYWLLKRAQPPADGINPGPGDVARSRGGAAGKLAQWVAGRNSDPFAASAALKLRRRTVNVSSIVSTVFTSGQRSASRSSRAGGCAPMRP